MNANINNQLLKEKFAAEDYEFCINIFKEEFKIKQNEEGVIIPLIPSEETMTTLEDFINYFTSLISSEKFNDSQLLLLNQIFRSLRNCMTHLENQNLIIKNDCLMNNISTLMQYFIKNETILSLKSILEFLCNLITNNKTSQIIIAKQFSDLIILSLDIPEVSHISLLIFYYILNADVNLIAIDLLFIVRVLKLCCLNKENDFLVVEVLLRENVMTRFYNDLDVELRCTLVKVILELAMNDFEDLPHELIKLLILHFKKKSDCILKTVTDYVDSIEPREVSILADCLAYISSSNETYQQILQTDKSLIINGSFLLKSIHEAGKSGNNNFTTLQKLSEVTIPSETIEKHPAFGFKVSLIQLIGNLCCKHKENQNLMRELEIIPLLLDCCNIDARNPLITQWVILAIRNLCENNLENQQIIANLNKVGVVDSAILHEMGLTLHDDGDKKVMVAPLMKKI